MGLYFILVKPAVPGNIGAAARALKTMGFNQLRLVDPCDHLEAEARMLAHASEDVLETAVVFENLEQAIADLDMTIATTAKSRDARVEYLDVREIPSTIRGKGDSARKVGLVFGREESGLTNDELRMCDLVSSIPMAMAYPSLNLAQSVMIYAYTIASEGLAVTGIETAEPDRQGFRAMMDKARKVLQDLDIDSSPALYNRILERLASLREDDVHLLHSILNRYLR
jgi:tRNA/rRNA methyltransferase